MYLCPDIKCIKTAIKKKRIYSALKFKNFDEISSLEKEVADTEAKMAAGEYDESLFASHAALQKKLENAMSLWELATMELEELEGE